MPSASPCHSAIFFYFLKNILPSAKDRHSAIFFLNLFCREPDPGTRQIFFYFLKTYFAECKPWALGNFFLFFKTYFAECQREALGNFFLKINFAECPLGRHSAKPTLPSAPMALDKIFFLFWAQIFFLWPCDSISNSILKFGAILTFFDIFH